MQEKSKFWEQQEFLKKTERLETRNSPVEASILR